MTRLTPGGYLSHVDADSARFREALATCDSTGRVPSCPDWTAHHLLAHLVESLTGLPAEEAVWTWGEDHSVGFILRRQALEALIHRIDAEQTSGRPSQTDALLAADGVLEVLDVMYGGAPAWGCREPSEQLLRVDVTDTGHQFWIRPGTFSGVDPGTGDELVAERDLQVVDAPADADLEPDAVVDGSAEKLLTWLWHRDDRAGVSMTGDPEVLAHVLGVLEHPID